MGEMALNLENMQENQIQQKDKGVIMTENLELEVRDVVRKFKRNGRALDANYREFFFSGRDVDPKYNSAEYTRAVNAMQMLEVGSNLYDKSASNSIDKMELPVLRERLQDAKDATQTYADIKSKSLSSRIFPTGRKRLNEAKNAAKTLNLMIGNLNQIEELESKMGLSGHVWKSEKEEKSQLDPQKEKSAASRYLETSRELINGGFHELEEKGKEVAADFSKISKSFEHMKKKDKEDATQKL